MIEREGNDSRPNKSHRRNWSLVNILNEDFYSKSANDSRNERHKEYSDRRINIREGARW